MFKVTHKFNCDHFLEHDEAVRFAKRQSKFSTGAFIIWSDDGQGELVDSVYENGACVRSEE